MSQNANLPSEYSDRERNNTSLKSLLESWDLIELYPKLEANGFTYRTLQYINSNDLDRLIGEDIHLTGPMIIFRSLVTEWQADSGKESSTCSSFKFKFTEEKDLETLLRSSGKGKDILKFRSKDTVLPEAMKKDLAKIIVDDTIQENLKLSRKEMMHIAHLICLIFPKEKEHMYYDKQAGQEPTGVLYVCYNNALRSLRKRKADTAEPSLTLEEQLSESLTDEVQTSLDFLKTDQLENVSTTLSHWRITFKYRKIKIGLSDVNEVLADWPMLDVVDAFILLTTDFGMKHGEENANALVSGWDRFWSEKLDRVLGMIHDPVVARELKAAKSSNNSDDKDEALLIALHHILVPSKTTVKKKICLPTIDDSKKTFLTVVQRLSDVKKKVEDRKEHCRKNELKFHPMVFKIKTGNNFIVVFHGIRYEFESIVHATDAAFKMFDFFEIPFPPECKNFWIFMQEFFYKTRTTEKLCHKAKILVEQLGQ